MPLLPPPLIVGTEWRPENDIEVKRGMAVSPGGFHSAAVGENGTLFVWGDGYDGQLGTGDTADRRAPVRVAGLPAPVRQVAAGASI